jgi:hypothetical protein
VTVANISQAVKDLDLEVLGHTVYPLIHGGVKIFEMRTIEKKEIRGGSKPPCIFH